MIVVALIAALAACAPAEPDWQAAQFDANEFLEASVQSDGVLGSVSGQVTRVPTEALMDEEGVTLTFPELARIERVEVACFGGGEAMVSMAVRTDSTWTGGIGVTVTCDGKPVDAPLAEPQVGVNAILVNGTLEKGTGAVFAAVVTGEVG